MNHTLDDNLLELLIKHNVHFYLIQKDVYYKAFCPFCELQPICCPATTKAGSFIISKPFNSFFCFSCKYYGGPKEFIKGINNEQTKKD